MGYLRVEHRDKRRISVKKKAKVLIVDDDPDLVDATKAVLQSTYRVICAYDGDDGLRKVVEHRPDLVILDVIMPGKDGFAVCRELRENPHYHFFSQIPVMLLTVFPRGMEKTNIPLSAGITTQADE